MANAEAVRAAVQAFSPEVMAPVCGIPADTLREVARAYATSAHAIILWGMGVSQHGLDIRLAQADHHIEDSRLPRAVRPQQPDDLAGLHIEGHPFDNFPSAETLY